MVGCSSQDDKGSMFGDVGDSTTSSSEAKGDARKGLAGESRTGPDDGLTFLGGVDGGDVNVCATLPRNDGGGEARDDAARFRKFLRTSGTSSTVLASALSQKASASLSSRASFRRLMISFESSSLDRSDDVGSRELSPSLSSS